MVFLANTNGKRCNDNCFSIDNDDNDKDTKSTAQQQETQKFGDITRKLHRLKRQLLLKQFMKEDDTIRHQNVPSSSKADEEGTFNTVASTYNVDRNDIEKVNDMNVKPRNNNDTTSVEFDDASENENHQDSYQQEKEEYAHLVRRLHKLKRKLFLRRVMGEQQVATVENNNKGQELAVHSKTYSSYDFDDVAVVASKRLPKLSECSNRVTAFSGCTRKQKTMTTQPLQKQRF